MEICVAELIFHLSCPVHHLMTPQIGGGQAVKSNQVQLYTTYTKMRRYTVTDNNVSVTGDIYCSTSAWETFSVLLSRI